MVAGTFAGKVPATLLWTLNAVKVPDGVDEAAIRRRLLDEFSIEIGAGLGPLAGKIWRVSRAGGAGGRSSRGGGAIVDGRSAESGPIM